MQIRSFLSIALSLFIATLFLAPHLPAQEVIELTGDDRRINAGFAEVYRVGSLDGQPWETLGQVGVVAFDARGNLHVFDHGSNPLEGRIWVMRQGAWTV